MFETVTKLTKGKPRLSAKAHTTRNASFGAVSQEGRFEASGGNIGSFDQYRALAADVIHEKLGASSQIELTLEALRRGFVDLDEGGK
jgi:hypothetical protein